MLAIDGAVRRAGWTFAGRAVAERFPVVAGPYIATVDATATLAGAWRGDRVGATVTVHGGRVRLADTGRELHDTGPLEDVVYVDRLGDRPEQEEDAGPTRIELAIATAEPVRVASPEADARVRADLTARIGDGLDWLAGRVWVVDGTVVLFEREYDIARAEARFAGPTPIDPDLDIELRRAFPAAVVSIFVSDRLSDPRVRFASDVPEYDDVQILSIILGQDPDEANNSTLPPEQRAANAVGGVLAGTVRDTLRLPIDVIRRHPDGWEVGKFLFGGRVLVGYRTRDGSDPSANLNEVTIEWRLRRNVVVEAFWGDEEAGAADILYVIRL
ncbi:MAG: hypothetical protein D6689_10505 [Deltaproteobacteria bacterium]|nr:MAG: hypothetical protein D6689_10505 [Deltaproteobacteria bacterium]